MNQAATLAIARLLDVFPPSSGNPDLTLDTFDRVLVGLPDQVIEDTVDRFLAGAVEGQNLRFAPSVAEFATEARRIAEMRKVINRPRLPAPPRGRGPSPFEISQEKARQKFAGWDVHAKDVSLDQVRNMHSAKLLPEGWAWCAALATIFVPRRNVVGE